ALLSAIGIAGMDRLVQRNVLAMSGRAVEAAGDVNTLLLDKTGTVTLGNRQAAEFLPVEGVGVEELADAAQLSSMVDETPEGRSIVVLAKERYALRGREEGELAGAEFVPFTAQSRMSGVDLLLPDGSGSRSLRKGAAAAVMRWVRENGGLAVSSGAIGTSGSGRAAGKVSSGGAAGAAGAAMSAAGGIVDAISASGGTPLVVAESTVSGGSGGVRRARVLGVIHLKDVVKEGMRERFDELR
ncbi:HAD family hydrolase, partial [Streptomyces sp. SID4917]